MIFLHSAQPPIIHRDIKASNIMIASDGQVKMIDYDAAKTKSENKGRDTVLIGTVGIAAPEQYGFSQSDERTDIYAFGKLIENVLPDSNDAMVVAQNATKLQPELRYQNMKQVKRAVKNLHLKNKSDICLILQILIVFLIVLMIIVLGYGGGNENKSAWKNEHKNVMGEERKISGTEETKHFTQFDNGLILTDKNYNNNHIEDEDIYIVCRRSR